MKEPRDWKTKPTDRFVLKWIKIHLSSRITPRLVDLPWLQPWMITLFSASLGIMAGAVFAMGFLAVVGSNCISYSTARAESHGITLGKPTLASKGTRSTVMVLAAWGSLAWAPLPFIALLYLAIHTNMAIFRRLMLAIATR